MNKESRLDEYAERLELIHIRHKIRSIKTFSKQLIDASENFTYEQLIGFLHVVVNMNEEQMEAELFAKSKKDRNKKDE